MPTESVLVISVANDQLELIVGDGSCSQCANQYGCKQFSLFHGDNKAMILPVDILSASAHVLAAGNKLELSIPATTLMKLSLNFYLLPLVVMLLAIWMATALGASEALVILAAVGGLVIGLGVSSFLLRFGEKSLTLRHE